VSHLSCVVRLMLIGIAVVRLAVLVKFYSRTPYHCVGMCITLFCAPLIVHCTL
jgi:hypothetical protein